ncbi:MAG: methionyl-tRNA formyltransferase [Pseudomonadota bacterium]
MIMRIAYAGTPEFAVPALVSLLSADIDLVSVITQPDRQSGRGRKIIESPVKKQSIASNVKVFQPENINSEVSLAYLGSMNLDVLIVAAYGQIFSQKLLELPRLGCINIHASLLPRWRGASPIQHAILNGDKNTGVTIMQMSKAMDAGDIWLQKSLPIEEEDTGQSLHDKLASLGGELMLPILKILKDGQAVATPQAQNEIIYCSKLQKQDGLINWNEDSESISRKIRALFPWPGAYTQLAGRRLLIHKACLENLSVTNMAPGTIHQVDREGIFVVTGKGSIKIETLTPEGGKKVSASDFSNSNQLLNCVLGE